VENAKERSDIFSGNSFAFSKNGAMFPVMKKLNPPKYRFTCPDPASLPETRYLICPNCHETLAPADIEAFSTCPFCNTRLEYSNELEDFILAPLVSQWMKAANASVRSRSNLQ
jgi:hypothetical protein